MCRWSMFEVIHLILKVENVTNDPCSGFCRTGSHIENEYSIAKYCCVPNIQHKFT